MGNSILESIKCTRIVTKTALEKNFWFYKMDFFFSYMRFPHNGESCQETFTDSIQFMELLTLFLKFPANSTKLFRSNDFRMQWDSLLSQPCTVDWVPSHIFISMITCLLDPPKSLKISSLTLRATASPILQSLRPPILASWNRRFVSSVVMHGIGIPSSTSHNI